MTTYSKSMQTRGWKKIYFLTLFLMSSPSLIFSQTFDTKGAIAPPEVNTQFMKDVHNSVNYQTGAINYSIRLFSLKVDDNLEIPIDLSYNSNGVKEYQSSGEVGVGWNLSINYRVTRTIYGRPDEYFPRPGSQEIIDSINSNTKYPRDRYLTRFTWGLPSNGGMTLVSGQTEMDGEYDIFDYSTPTLSGSFVIENVTNKTIRLAENLLTKFDFVNDANGIRSFTIKEPNGNKVVAGYDSIRGGYFSDYINTYLGKKSSYSWPITQITTPANKNVQFTYIQKEVPNFRLSNERAITISEVSTPGDPYPSSTSIDDHTDGTSGANLTYLTDSIISEYGIIKLYRSTPYQFIDSVAIFDYTGKLLKKAIFSRSFSHEYYFLDSVRIIGGVSVQDEKYQFEYYSRNIARVTPDIWDNLRIPDTDEPVSDAKAYPKELGDEIYWKREINAIVPYSVGPLIGSGANRLPRETPDYFSLKKVILPTGGHNSFTYESNYFYSYSQGSSKIGPGIRVLSSSAYDPVANKTITHYYKYGIDKNNNGNLIYGYGYIPVEITPSHYGLYQVVLYQDISSSFPYFVPGRFLTFSNSVIADNDPFFVRYNVVSYPVVIDSTENGTTWYYYKSNKQGIWNTTREFGPGFFSTYKLSEKPYLEKKEIYNKGGQRLQLEEYTYGMITDQPLTGLKVKPYALFASSFTPAYTLYSYGEGGNYPNGVSGSVSSIYDYGMYTIEFGLQVLTNKSITEFSGSNSIVTTANYTYNNRGQIIKETNIKSNQPEELQIDYTYPNDLGTLSGTDNLTKDVIKMRELNMVNSWVERRFSKNTNNNGVITNTLLRSNFITIYGGLNKPRALYSVNFSGNSGSSFIPVNSTGGTINIDVKYEKSLSEILETDNGNNPSLIKDEGGVMMAYVWDYNQLYPVAQSTSSSVAEIAYTSFEADGKGNWVYTYPDGPQVSGAITGKRYLNIDSRDGNATISKENLQSGKQYILSYWSKGNTSFSIVGGTSTHEAGRNVAGWYFHKHVVDATSSTISVIATDDIDELRIYPATAQMITYTYEPLIGMTSQCDANNKITYYEYDSFGRLKTVRDQDMNVIKTMDYQYQKPYNQ